MRQGSPLSLPAGMKPAARKLDARITFTANGPLGISVRGRGADMTCFAEGEAVVFAVDLRGITTGISMRDGTMHDLLRTSRFPAAELRVPRAAILVPGKKGQAEGKAPCTLILRNQAGPVDVSYTLKRQGDTLEIKGTLNVLVSQWGVRLPRHMGFGLKSMVAVKVDIAAPLDALKADEPRQPQHVVRLDASAAPANDV